MKYKTHQELREITLKHLKDKIDKYINDGKSKEEIIELLNDDINTLAESLVPSYSTEILKDYMKHNGALVYAGKCFDKYINQDISGVSKILSILHCGLVSMTYDNIRIIIKGYIERNGL